MPLVRSRQTSYLAHLAVRASELIVQAYFGHVSSSSQRPLQERGRSFKRLRDKRGIARTVRSQKYRTALHHTPVRTTLRRAKLIRLCTPARRTSRCPTVMVVIPNERGRKGVYFSQKKKENLIDFQRIGPLISYQAMHDSGV